MVFPDLKKSKAFKGLASLIGGIFATGLYTLTNPRRLNAEILPSDYPTNPIILNITPANSIDDIISQNIPKGSYEQPITHIADIKTGKRSREVVFNNDETRAYVANERSNDINIIDNVNNFIIETISSGGWYPSGLVLNQRKNSLYVSLNGSHAINIIDLDTKSVRKTVDVGKWPDRIIQNPDSTEIYVPNIADDSISIIDTSIDKVIKTINNVIVAPGELMFGQDGFLYVIGNTGLAKIDPEKEQVIKRFAGEEFDIIQGIDQGKNGLIYLANSGKHNVTVVDPEQGIIGYIPLSERPIDVKVSKDGSRLYVIDYRENEMRIFDISNLSTNNFVYNELSESPIPTQKGPLVLKLSKDNKTLYVLCQNFSYNNYSPSFLQKFDTGFVSSTELSLDQEHYKRGDSFILTATIAKADLNSIDNISAKLFGKQVEMHDDGINGDKRANDGIFSLQENIPKDESYGEKTLEVIVRYDSGYTKTKQATLTVIPKTPSIIHTKTYDNEDIDNYEIKIEDVEDSSLKLIGIVAYDREFNDVVYNGIIPNEIIMPFNENHKGTLLYLKIKAQTEDGKYSSEWSNAKAFGYKLIDAEINKSELSYGDTLIVKTRLAGDNINVDEYLAFKVPNNRIYFVKIGDNIALPKQDTSIFSPKIENSLPKGEYTLYPLIVAAGTPGYDAENYQIKPEFIWEFVDSIISLDKLNFNIK
jgi:YVTN family beta-propeller protein